MDTEGAESSEIISKVQELFNELDFGDAANLDGVTSKILAIILETVQNIYEKNQSLVDSNEAGIEILRTNFKMTLSLMSSSDDLLMFFKKSKMVHLKYIPKVPLSLAELIFITFDHCKNVQKSYKTYYRSVTEILDLFRKAQELHTNYLSFLETLVIDFVNETDIKTCKQVLEQLLKIGKSLSGVNMKSMADNWKGFIMLMQKSCENDLHINLSLPIQILSDEINNNLIELSKSVQDSKKCGQNIKIIGFLIKVLVKLFEINTNMEQYFGEVLDFWIMLHNWHYTFVQNNIVGEGLSDSVGAILQLSSESIANLVQKNPSIIEKAFSNLPSNNSFAVLNFINIILKTMPKIVIKQGDAIRDSDIPNFLQSIFILAEKCYVEYFTDQNSDFYGDIVINITVIILLYPNQFQKIEKMLLTSIIRENIYVALIATDIWILILKHSNLQLCVETLSILLNKITNLNLVFNNTTPAIVRLKNFTQRIFKVLCDRKDSTQTAKFNPSNNLSCWKILNLKNVPLSHRFFIEFILYDISEKINIFQKDDNMNELLGLIDGLNMISYTDFNELQINATKLVPFLIRLWSFNQSEVFLNSHVCKYFLCSLIKITMAVICDLSDEQIVIILAQIKQFLVLDTIFKILICDMLKALYKKTINSSEKSHIYSSLTNTFQTLLNDKNEIVIQRALESLFKLSQNHSYDCVVEKVTNSSNEMKKLVTNYFGISILEGRYDLVFLSNIEKITFRHECKEVENDFQPAYKKRKLEDDANLVLNKLKNITEEFQTVSQKTTLTGQQKSDIKSIISKLEMLL